MAAVFVFIGIVFYSPCTIDAKDTEPNIANLSSPVESVRQAAFMRLITIPPSTMTPLISLAHELKPSINANGKLQHNNPPHYAIRLLGHHHQAVDTIEALVEQIGCSLHDQFVSHTGAYPSTVQALVNIGKPCIPRVLKKLGNLTEDGIKRHHCLLVLAGLYGRVRKGYRVSGPTGRDKIAQGNA